MFAMWGLIVLGGGILVLILGPISIVGYGDVFDYYLTSGLKAIAAVVLVVVWIVVLAKMKNKIFSKKFNF